MVKYSIRDISLAEEGKKKIDWAYTNMPVLREIEKEFIKDQPFAGIKIAVSVHVEAKTACLVKLLRTGGATVALTGCNPLSTQDDVAAALVAEGISVFCRHNATKQEYHDHLLQTLEFKPNIIIDDGGDLAQIMHTELKNDLSGLIGGCEETTTGVHRLKILEKENKLLYPVIAVNDARCKHLFDNRYGTGQSTLTALMVTTNLLIAGKTVVIAGYGMCGKGIALRAKGLGAKVVITEIDPIKASEALMEGMDVMTMDQAAAAGDFFITVTGCKDVITSRHYKMMKNGVILANAGHFDVEINIPDLEKLSVDKVSKRQNITGYQLPDGSWINLLAEGRLVNLAAGDGHPVEIMDMSFALQALSCRYMVENGGSMKAGVYQIPPEIDEKVGYALLKSKNLVIDSLSDEQNYYINHWEI
ncbi:MAG: adenosylhomocysteinase [Saccharofermentanales bacterium]